MIKKFSLLTLTFISFLFVGMLMPKVYAAENVNFDITVVKSSGTTLFSPSLPYGAEATIDLDGLDLGENVAFFVYNNEILPADVNTKFLVSASTNVTVVVKEPDDKVAVLMDTNGEFLEAFYNPEEAPVPTKTPTKPGYTFQGFGTTEISKDTVFAAEYERSNNDSLKVTVVGGTIDLTEPKYNDVVTLTPTNPESFSHWIDEAGHIVSRNPNHKLTVLEELTLTAVNEGSSVITPHVYMRDVSGIRTGYDSMLGFVEYDINTQTLVEYGFITSPFDGPIILENAVKVTSKSLSPNNEFLHSFKEDDFSRFVAYAILKDNETKELIKVYANGFNEYTVNLNVDAPEYSPSKIHFVGKSTGWSFSQFLIEKSTEGDFNENIFFLAQKEEKLEFKLSSSDSWSYEAFYGTDRSLTPGNRTITFSDERIINYNVKVETWKAIPVNPNDPAVPNGHYRVYYFTAGYWGELQIHYFGDDVIDTSWPGEKMIFSSGYYYYDIPASGENFGFVFNEKDVNKDNSQSYDLTYDSSATYYYWINSHTILNEHGQELWRWNIQKTAVRTDE